MTEQATQPSPWNVANAVTLVRVLLVPVFAWLLLDDQDASRVAAFAVFVVAIVSDSVDGDLARRHGLVTDLGAIADPIADKALIGTALVGLSLLGELSWWVTAVVMVREVGVTALRFAVLRYGVIPASRGGKTKTVLQSAAVGLLLLPLPHGVRAAALWLMAAAVVVTVVTGADYVHRAWRMVRLARDPTRA